MLVKRMIRVELSWFNTAAPSTAEPCECFNVAMLIEDGMDGEKVKPRGKILIYKYFCRENKDFSFSTV